MKQLEIPLEHDFIVTVVATYKLVVRAESALKAQQLVEAGFKPNSDVKVISSVRADLVEPDEPEEAPEPPPHRGNPNKGGSPAGGTVHKPQFVDADARNIAVAA